MFRLTEIEVSVNRRFFKPENKIKNSKPKPKNEKIFKTETEVSFVKYVQKLCNFYVVLFQKIKISTPQCGGIINTVSG